MASDLENPLWRLRNLYKCREEGTGRAINFILRPEQEMLAKHLLEHPTVPMYVIKSRRLGISTFIDTFESDCATFQAGFRGLIIDQTQADATKKMIEIVRFAIDSLPPEITSKYIFDKRNDSELRFRLKHEPESKDSVIYATTGGRGGDCSMLHVSEWGPISALDPVRSREIRTGVFPSARKGRRVVETTWYGGKSGELWDLVKPIMDADPNAEGMIYFFPWHADPQAVKIDGTVTPAIEDYFRELGAKIGKKFSQEQKKWYAAKKLEQGMWVAREYPSTLAEALAVPMAGAIFAEQMDDLRQRKRIHDFASEASVPAYTFWDIGLSDYGCIWLAQFVGRDILLLDYCSASGEPAAFYADKVRQWERKHGVVVRTNFLPHDADTRERSSGRSYKDALIEAGLTTRELRVVPRTPDIWLGLNSLRTLFPRFFIHATNCGAQVKMVGETIPSGIECLDYYHKRVVTNSGSGTLIEEPVHDQYSHGTSALRTLAEAASNGMLEGASATAKEARHGVVNVRRVGGESYGQRRGVSVNVLR